MSIKEEIHGLTDEMLTNLGRLVAIDSQLGTPAEGMPFGEGPAKVLEEALKIADELGFKTVNLDNYCGYAEMGEGEEEPNIIFLYISRAVPIFLASTSKSAWTSVTASITWALLSKNKGRFDSFG